ncbi:MAG TPA: hypothetical protein VF300_01585 [Methanothrix sp.]
MRLFENGWIIGRLKGAIEMVEHKQITVFDPASNGVIEVDEGIAPLLKAIWSFGITTCNSCQENRPGVVWIEFLTMGDAEAFLTHVVSGLDPIVSPEANNWLYSRIIGENGGWQYNAHPHDTRDYMDDLGRLELDATEACAIALSLSVRFPVADYGRLLELVGRDIVVRNN